MKKYEVTLKILRDNDACKDRYEHLTKALGEGYGDDTSISLIKILELNGVEDCLWAFRCFLEELDLELKIIAVKFAICIRLSASGCISIGPI